MPKAQLDTGIDLYYEEFGTGSPVVLMPGTGFALDVWKLHPVDELKANHRVIIFDSRGLGRTECDDEFFTIDQLAADVAGLLDHLDAEPAHVLGHSIGGRIALELALTYPRRVRSLIMAASGSGAAIRFGEDAFPMPQHRLLVRLIERGLEEHVRHEILETDGYFTESFRAEHPDIVKTFYEATWKNHSDLSNYLRYAMARHAYEATHRLPFLKTPTMVLVGDSDIAGGGPHLHASKNLADRINGCQLTIMEGVSHGFFWQQPEKTVEILESWFDGH